MNNSIKEVLSFIKEILELKNKNIYNVNNYEIYLDLNAFYSKFEKIIDIPDYKKINILSDGVIFKLKYIHEEYKKNIQLFHRN